MPHHPPLPTPTMVKKGVLGRLSHVLHLHHHVGDHHHRHGHHHHHGHHYHHGHHEGGAPTTPSPSATMMEENIAAFGAIIAKWDPETSNYAKINPLFQSDRAEAMEFIHAVVELQRAMLFFSSDEIGGNQVSSSDIIIRAQNLMQAAMRRLEREMHRILSDNRDRFDADSVSTHSSNSTITSSDPDDAAGNSEDDISMAGKSVGEVEDTSALAMADLRAIADTMIHVGYGKECLQIYKAFRKSVIDEGFHRLGFERLTPHQLQKLDWGMTDQKIGSWLSAAKLAVKSLFAGERVLCDYVFGGSSSIDESCFADITKEVAVQFLGFPEFIAKSKRFPERVIRMMELYDAMTELCPEIDFIFSFESTAVVRSQATTSCFKLAEAVRGALAEFEHAIHKDASKAPVTGGGVHPLTQHAIHYIAALADYEETLADIYGDLHDDGSGEQSPIATKLASLVAELLSKMDSKANAYKDAALAYLFLANNLQFIVNKVRSCQLGVVLGEEWVSDHAKKVRGYVAGYERSAWGMVMAALPPGVAVAEGEAKERMRAFGAALEEACAVQRGWVVADDGLREELKASIAGMVLPVYKAFYERYRVALRDSGVVRFAPEDVRNRLAELFSNTGTGSGSSRSSGSTYKGVIGTR